MDELVKYLALGTNGFALLVAGWIYLAYVRNLKAQLAIKDSEIKVIEANLVAWKDKAKDLERRTPEYVEVLLEKRIKVREAEIKRLSEDTERNSELLRKRSMEIEQIRLELEKAKAIVHPLTYYDSDLEEEVLVNSSEIVVEEIGFVFVDSGSLMITDPCYINGLWDSQEKYEDVRLFKDKNTLQVFQFEKDFSHFEEIIPSYKQSANELVKNGTWIRLETSHELTYSYPGAAYATLTKEGHGVLKFKDGGAGVAVAFRTVAGDGSYPVYGERYRGELLRVYVELQ